MDFDRSVLDIMPNRHCISFNFAEVKFPSNKDVFFRAKQTETLDRYLAARRFMCELDTDDWKHYFPSEKDELAKQYYQHQYRSQYYEAALMFYNSVIDLSWVTCYISAESLIHLNGKSIDTEKILPIEEAYRALRKAEGHVQNPCADDSFTYLKKMCPEFTDAIDYIIEFWKSFSGTPIRYNYNYLKHRGALYYKENPSQGCMFRLICNGQDCPSNIRDVRKEVSLNDSIEQLREFDNKTLFPYIETLFNMLEQIVDPSPMVF